MHHTWELQPIGGALPRIDAAAAVQRVDFDVYPYAAGSIALPERQCGWHG
jgi:hypothetical protein